MTKSRLPHMCNVRGSAKVAVLLATVAAAFLLFAIVGLSQRASDQTLPPPPLKKFPPSESAARGAAAPTKEDLRRRIEQEQAASASFRKAQSEYQSAHRAARDSDRRRQADARHSATLAAGTRMQLASSELSSWIFAYPEPASVAARMNGGARLQRVTDELWEWYSGLGERIDALADAECALAAAGGARRDRSLTTPSMLEMTKFKSELREPSAYRLSSQFGLDGEAAEWLAGQLRPRWRETNDRINAGLARIEKARAAALSDAEKEQLLCNGQIRLVRAIDGDTIEILVRDNISDAEFTDRVRLLNVNTPEIGTPGASEATSRTDRECQGDLTLEFERPGQITRDKYGRVLAFVFAGGVFVNAELIKRGHSSFYTEYGEGRYAQYFRFLESMALRTSQRE